MLVIYRTYLTHSSVYVSGTLVNIDRWAATSAASSECEWIVPGTLTFADFA